MDFPLLLESNFPMMPDYNFSLTILFFGLLCPLFCVYFPSIALPIFTFSRLWVNPLFFAFLKLSIRGCTKCLTPVVIILKPNIPKAIISNCLCLFGESTDKSVAQQWQWKGRDLPSFSAITTNSASPKLNLHLSSQTNLYFLNILFIYF